MTIEQIPYLGDVYEFVKQRCESFIGKLIIISGNFLQIQRNQLEMLYHMSTGISLNYLIFFLFHLCAWLQCWAFSDMNNLS